MQIIEPTNYVTRGFHYRTLLKEGAQFQEYNDHVIAVKYGTSSNQEVLRAQNLGLADVTPLPRTGFKGHAAINWLRGQGLTIGNINNRAYRQKNGVLAARLADSEVLILNPLHTQENPCITLEKNYTDAHPAHCYSVPRFNSNAWLIVTGQNASAMFAKICGVDLRLNKFTNGFIAQTSIARINGVIIRDNFKDTPAFHLLFDSASTDYMWSCLKDAFAEFDGALIGYQAICTL